MSTGRALGTILSVVCFLLLGESSHSSPPSRAFSPTLIRHSEELVARSVVRIERQTTYRVGADKRRMINHGTGVIIGREHVNGRQEYLVLSNEHVANNYHVAGESTLYIVVGANVYDPIPLKTLAVDSRRDQALLRTVGCNETFAVPDYVIGSPQEDITLDTVFTEGYGNGTFGILEGKVLSTDYKDWGMRCYKIGIRVGGGQSGAPLVVMGTDKRLYLAALIFCGNERYSAATPLYPGKGVLHELSPRR
jgi:hypothetical protein